MDLMPYRYLLIAAAGSVTLIAYAVSHGQELLSPYHRQRTRRELIVLCAAIAIGLVAIYGRFLNGELAFSYSDAGADTQEQYVPFYAWFIQSIKDGSLGLWTFDYELGTPLAGIQSWVYDPANLILVPLALLLGVQHLSVELAVVQCVKIALAALLFDHLLTYYCVIPSSRIIGSLLFAFSGAIVLRGQHYFLGTALPLLALLILSLERYLERQTPARFLLVALSVGAVVGWSAYIAFMELSFAVVYVILRIAQRDGRAPIGRHVRNFCSAAVPVVCGILLAGVTLVPYVHFLLRETGRVSSSGELSASARVASAASLVPLSWLGPIASRMLGGGLIDNGITGGWPVAPLVEGADVSDVYEFIMLGYSVGAFILLGQFASWLVHDTDRRTRAIWGVAIGLVMLYCLDWFLPTLLNAFVKLSYRSSYLLAIPICIAIALGWEHRVAEGRIDVPAFVITASLTLLTLVWSLRNTQTGRRVCLAFLALFALVTLVIVLLMTRGRCGRWLELATSVVAAALFATTVIDAAFVTNHRATVDAGHFPLSSVATADDNTRAALQWVRNQDGDFYRIEKTYNVWCPLNDSLVDRYASASAYNSTPDGDIDDFYHMLWPEAIYRRLAYSQGYMKDADEPDLAALLCIRYVLSTGPMDLPWLTLVDQKGDVCVYRNELATSFVTVQPTLVPESEADALPDAEARRSLLATGIIVPDEVADEHGTDQDSDDLALPACVSTFSQESPTSLAGSVLVSKDCFACLPIPNTGDWTIAIDGNQVDTFRADYGFIGFRMPEGEHEVSATYRPAGLTVGLCCTAAGILLGGLVLVGLSKHAGGQEPAKHSKTGDTPRHAKA